MRIIPGYANGGEVRPYVPGAALQQMPVGEPPEAAPEPRRPHPKCDACIELGRACRDHDRDPVASMAAALGMTAASQLDRADRMPWSGDLSRPTVEVLA